MTICLFFQNGCLAGCLTNSCLMTPIYARRAFAHANLGKVYSQLSFTQIKMHTSTI